MYLIYELKTATKTFTEDELIFSSFQFSNIKQNILLEKEAS